MKKYIVINKKQVFFIEAPNSYEAKQKAIEFVDNSHAVNIFEYNVIYGNPLTKVLRLAKNAIGAMLIKCNGHNKKTGHTKGLEWGLINEMNQSTSTLIQINKYLE